MSRSQTFCFTLPNYTPEEESILQHFTSPVIFMCYGRELAPTTGTPHLQGFLALDNRIRLGTVKKHLKVPRIHLAACKGDFYQNIRYCTKDKDFFISDPDIQEQYELTKDFDFPYYWIDKEIYEFRVCYNPDCDITFDERVKQHDSFVSFLLNQYPKYSRSKIFFTAWDSDDSEHPLRPYDSCLSKL